MPSPRTLWPTLIEPVWFPEKVRVLPPEAPAVALNCASGGITRKDDVPRTGAEPIGRRPDVPGAAPACRVGGAGPGGVRVPVVDRRPGRMRGSGTEHDSREHSPAGAKNCDQFLFHEGERERSSKRRFRHSPQTGDNSHKALIIGDLLSLIGLKAPSFCFPFRFRTGESLQPRHDCEKAKSPPPVRRRSLCLLAALAGTLLQAGATPTSIVVTTDDRPVPEIDGAFVLPPSFATLRFVVGDHDLVSHPFSGRVRYRLEGVDPAWQERTTLMDFSVYFYAPGHDRVGDQPFPVSGKSAGWNETPEKSTFTHRREVVTVPPRAAYFSVAVTSAGPPSAVGVYIVRNVRVSRLDPSGTPSAPILDSGPFLQGAAPGSWMADGTRPSMATLPTLRADDPSSRVFCIVDTDAWGHAEWHSIWEEGPRVTPGDRLSVEWDEMYEIGVADRQSNTYSAPPPGRYRFTVQETDAFDRPLPLPELGRRRGAASLLEEPVVLDGVAVAGRIPLRPLGPLRDKGERPAPPPAGPPHGGGAAPDRARPARRPRRPPGPHLPHQLVRPRIRRRRGRPAPTSGDLRGMARELVSALSEVVWTVNPEIDRLESLASFLCQAVQKQCDAARAPLRDRRRGRPRGEDRPRRGAPPRHPRVKEAVTNALRHAGAARLRFRVRFAAPLLVLEISDDGRASIRGARPGTTAWRTCGSGWRR